MHVAVATSSTTAAAGARTVIADGGNAVDAAIAAALVSMNTEPGVCALAGGGYVTVWPPDDKPVTYDGYVTVPGRDGQIAPPDGHVVEVEMAYGGGIRTLVGPGSVAVPAALAALDGAWREYGSRPWQSLMQPAVDVTANGFPLPKACHYYLCYSGESIFSRAADSRRALYDANGRLRDTGAPVVVPYLAESLAAIAEQGADEFYRGKLGARIADHVSSRGGALTRADLANTVAARRDALCLDYAGWQLATNPAPAIGGAILVAMLETLRAVDPIDSGAIAAVCSTVLNYRRQRLDLSEDLNADVTTMLDRAAAGGWRPSASTVHTSAVDSEGRACAITMSSGYGSGEMPPRTGLWLNNCLGEIDLNRRGLSVGEPGTRLISNMAPSVARHGDATLAIGSPGASRITTALLQTLIGLMRFGRSLEDAIAAPRLHVEVTSDGIDIAAEPGIELPGYERIRYFDAPNMYFGGVAAALKHTDGTLEAAADGRREGGTCIAW